MITMISEGYGICWWEIKFILPFGVAVVDGWDLEAHIVDSLHAGLHLVTVTALGIPQFLLDYLINGYLRVYSTRTLYFCCFSILWYHLYSYILFNISPSASECSRYYIDKSASHQLPFPCFCCSSRLTPTNILLMRICNPCSVPNTLLLLLPIDSVY